MAPLAGVTPPCRRGHGQFVLPTGGARPGVEGVAVLRRGRRGSAAGRDRADPGRRAKGGVAKAWRRASLANGLCSVAWRCYGSGAKSRTASRGCWRALPTRTVWMRRRWTWWGGASPKGSICRRPSGARTPPSASPSTPHLGAECGRGRPRTKSSTRYSELISSAETGAELTSRLGAIRRKEADVRRVPARDSWLVVWMRTGTSARLCLIRHGCPAGGLTRSCC